MSRPKFYTEAGSDRRINEGRGHGHGPNYQSWLRITDRMARVPFKITVHFHFDPKTDQMLFAEVSAVSLLASRD